MKKYKRIAVLGVDDLVDGVGIGLGFFEHALPFDLGGTQAVDFLVQGGNAFGQLGLELFIELLDLFGGGIHDDQRGIGQRRDECDADKDQGQLLE
ncbi:MAG: hypothetical protein IPJ12_13495 [Betaproteobacteria bacterium]|nr:hypothetical protein [Betaproteobacteria bacterium]